MKLSKAELKKGWSKLSFGFRMFDEYAFLFLYDKATDRLIHFYGGDIPSICKVDGNTKCNQNGHRFLVKIAPGIEKIYFTMPLEKTFAYVKDWAEMHQRIGNQVDTGIVRRIVSILSRDTLERLDSHVSIDLDLDVVKSHKMTRSGARQVAQVAYYM